jgi:branched-chain amino acid transport system permease protein
VLGVAQTVGNQIDVQFDFLSGPLFGHLIFLVVLAFRPSGLLGSEDRS